MNDSANCAAQAKVASVRARRRDRSDEATRAARAMSLVQVGELSAARQALEGAALAPGNLATLRALTDPAKRPPFPREELSVEVAHVEPEEPFQLDAEEFLLYLRKARRGAAAGRSGMTSDHLFPALENEGDSDLFVRASLLASGNVPPAIAQAIRLGRMTALSKPDGGVWGIVVGDIIRRLVARSIAKQISKKVEAMTTPFQHALSTKAGCKCVAYILQSMTDLDPDTTITSIDGVGAYDLISRNAMLEGLLQMDGGNQIVPFVRMFYGSPSTYLWEDEMGATQYIPQGKEESKVIRSCQCSTHWEQHGSLVATLPCERTWEGGAGAVHRQRRTSQSSLHRSAPWQNPGLEQIRFVAQWMRH